MLLDNITGFQHLGLPVTNIENSFEFYEQLGFSAIMTKELLSDDGAIKVCMLEIKGFVLELYQLTGSELEEIKARSHGHIDHIALDVTDIYLMFEAVKQAGFQPLEDAPVFLPFWEKGVYYFNILGPDGEKVEFNQRIK